MNYTSDTHSAGFGVSSCSVLTLGKGLKAREEKSEWKIIAPETSFFCNFLSQSHCSPSSSYTLVVMSSFFLFFICPSQADTFSVKYLVFFTCKKRFFMPDMLVR